MKILFVLILLSIYIKVHAQAEKDSIKSELSSDEFSSVGSKDSVQLLPKNYMLTQRILWGENGLMREMDYFKLSEAERMNEMQLRKFMITSHEYLGYAALAGMIAEAYTGEKLYTGDKSMRHIHGEVAAALNLCYFSSAGLAFFAPPPMTDRHQGNAIKIHKWLSIVHFSSMVATNVLAGDPKLKAFHRDAAYLAFGAFLASIVVVDF